MTDYTIEEFCNLHDACEEGRKWALENCGTMKDVWNTANPAWLVWVATRDGVLTDRELRLFACWCVRQVWHLLDDERSKRAVEVAERYAVGEASDKELARAMAAARDAARDAAWDAAWAAAMDAAWARAMAAARAAARDAAMDAAWAAAMDAARAAARDAARDAAMDAAMDAARDAAWDGQAKYLREHCNPNFEKQEGM